jgi:hypothetical protein
MAQGTRLPPRGAAPGDPLAAAPPARPAGEAERQPAVSEADAAAQARGYVGDRRAASGGAPLIP